MRNLSAIGLLIAIVLLAGAGAIVAQEVLPFPVKGARRAPGEAWGRGMR